MTIKLGQAIETGNAEIAFPIYWNPRQVPHLLISGTTGGGKTVLAQYILSQLLETGATISICDFKAGGDWSGILADYGEYQDCDRVLSAFYDSFIETIEQKQRANKYLLFDEFSSFALFKDTKQFKDLMTKVGHLAFMGRSFGFHLILISQQFNAKVLDTAIREQFGVKIYMGASISSESAQMLFPNCEIDKSHRLPPCCGYIASPDKDLQILQMPFISRPEKLKKLLEKKGRNSCM